MMVYHSFCLAIGNFYIILPTLSHFVNSSSGRPLEIKIGSIAVIKAASASSVPHLAPALNMALREIRAKYDGMINITHEFITDPIVTNCNPLLLNNAERMAAEWYYRKMQPSDVKILLTAGCHEVILTKRLATEWNILQITSGSDEGHNTRGVIASNWIAVSRGATIYAIQTTQSLFQKINWTSIFLVHCNGSHPVFYTQFTQMMAYFDELGPYRINAQTVNFRHTKPDNETSGFRALLNEFQSVSRVMLYFGHSDGLRSLMINAARLNMAAGEHVYIASQALLLASAEGDFGWFKNDSYDSTGKLAFESVLIISSKSADVVSDETRRILGQWKAAAHVKYNVTIPEMAPSAKYAYMALHMTAEIFNETWAKQPGFSFSRGDLLAQKFRNRGSTPVSIRGDVVLEKVIKMFNSTSETFEVAFEGTTELTEVNGGIWTGGRDAPLNEPVCGYLGGRCGWSKNGFGMSQIWIGFSAALAIGIIVGVWVKRQCERINNPDWWHLKTSEIASTEITDQQQTTLAPTSINFAQISENEED